jgi:hypothetical protein
MTVSLPPEYTTIYGYLGHRYNTSRPQQGMGMAAPVQRFSTAAARAEEDLLPLQLSEVIALAPAPEPVPEPEPVPARPLAQRGRATRWSSTGVVPPSGNMEVLGKPFWLGTAPQHRDHRPSLPVPLDERHGGST